jgi:hypothetical protein
MKEKNIWRVIVIMLLLCLLCEICIADNIPNGKKGKSNIAHLYLYEKDSLTWNIVENGSWGKMKYVLSGELFDFVFNAHNLTLYENYTLIYYPDPWPGEGLIVLGKGMVNDEGNIHISGKINTGDLPALNDENFANGAKIWLVLTDDVDFDELKIIGWNPSEYLFEYDLISFNDLNEEITELTNSTSDNENESSDEGDEVIQTLISSDEANEMVITDANLDNNSEHLQEVFINILIDRAEKNKELPSGLIKIMTALELIR